MKKVLTAIVISLIGFAGYSQTDRAQSVKVFMKPVNASGKTLASDAFETNPSAAPFNDISLVVELPTLTGVSQIKVEMGRSNGTEIANTAFNVDGSSVPSGMSYQQNGKRAILGLGKYSGVDHYTATITLIDANGVASQPFVVSH